MHVYAYMRTYARSYSFQPMHVYPYMCAERMMRGVPRTVPLEAVLVDLRYG